MDVFCSRRHHNVLLAFDLLVDGGLSGAVSEQLLLPQPPSRLLKQFCTFIANEKMLKLQKHFVFAPSGPLSRSKTIRFLSTVLHAEHCIHCLVLLSSYHTAKRYGLPLKPSISAISSSIILCGASCLGLIVRGGQVSPAWSHHHLQCPVSHPRLLYSRASRLKSQFDISGRT